MKVYFYFKKYKYVLISKLFKQHVHLAWQKEKIILNIFKIKNSA